MSAGVVVGYDGSECAKAALRTGLEVGRAYGEKELAIERDARVIVVGSRGQSPIRGALLGATPAQAAGAGRPAGPGGAGALVTAA